MTIEGTPGPLRLVRWTVTSGSNSQSRGAVVIAAADHLWEASTEGAGPIAALCGSVNTALLDVLGGPPRLVSFDIHALRESLDAEGLVTLALEPPAGAGGDRARGRFEGRASHVNIIAASIEAYLAAINLMLSEAPWAGVAEEAGRSRDRRPADAAGPATELVDGHDEVDTTAWFNR